MTAIALVVLQILRTLAWAGVHQQPGQFVWRTAAEFEQAWVADRGAKEKLPAVDFDKEMVLAVFAGMKKTGGYRIAIEKVVAKPGKVYVLYRQTVPAPGGPVTMAITFPSHVVVVPKTEGEVMFFPVDSPQGKEILSRVQ